MNIYVGIYGYPKCNKLSVGYATKMLPISRIEIDNFLPSSINFLLHIKLFIVALEKHINIVTKHSLCRINCFTDFKTLVVKL